jgi:hypothetical protein
MIDAQWGLKRRPLVDLRKHGVAQRLNAEYTLIAQSRAWRGDQRNCCQSCCHSLQEMGGLSQTYSDGRAQFVRYNERREESAFLPKVLMFAWK